MNSHVRVPSTELLVLPASCCLLFPQREACPGHLEAQRPQTDPGSPSGELGEP